MIGSISLGHAFVAGRKLAPNPATGNIACRTELRATKAEVESVEGAAERRSLFMFGGVRAVEGTNQLNHRQH